MSEDTPTTDEIRETYAWGCKNEGAPAEGAPEAEFDRWLAKVEREAAARALEEAAEEVFADPDEMTLMQREAFDRGADAVYNALRARAAEIREGKSE